jgi:hypothetical protein
MTNLTRRLILAATSAATVAAAIYALAAPYPEYI